MASSLSYSFLSFLSSNIGYQAPSREGSFCIALTLNSSVPKIWTFFESISKKASRGAISKIKFSLPPIKIASNF